MTPTEAESLGIILDQKPVKYLGAEVDELLRLNSTIQKDPALLFKAITRSGNEVKLDRFITKDPLMLQMKRNVEAIIRSPYNKLKPVLITGPSGTGKEIVARAFQTIDTPFVAQNCAGIPKELIHSLLFGHLKGTFTGADKDKDGLFVQAEDGTVFLDEIGELSLEAQAVLLRVLQFHTVTKLGSIKEEQVHCRVIAATKRNLRLMVEDGTFREDLFARLMTFEIYVTGLSNRIDDIALIASKGFDSDNQPLNYNAPIPEAIIASDIARYNVRAIQAFVARMRTYGSY